MYLKTGLKKRLPVGKLPVKASSLAGVTCVAFGGLDAIRKLRRQVLHECQILRPFRRNSLYRATHAQDHGTALNCDGQIDANGGTTNEGNIFSCGPTFFPSIAHTLLHECQVLPQ